jgi:hypothetical protein
MSGENYIAKSFLICTVRQVCLEDEVKGNKIDRACSTNVEEMNAYRLLVGKPERKGLLGRSRLMWVDRS